MNRSSLSRSLSSSRSVRTYSSILEHNMIEAQDITRHTRAQSQHNFSFSLASLRPLSLVCGELSLSSSHTPLLVCSRALPLSLSSARTLPLVWSSKYHKRCFDISICSAGFKSRICGAASGSRVPFVVPPNMPSRFKSTICRPASPRFP